MRISDWSSDVCSSDLQARYADFVLFGPVDAYGNAHLRRRLFENIALSSGRPVIVLPAGWKPRSFAHLAVGWNATREATRALGDALKLAQPGAKIDILVVDRSEEHTSELQSLMSISYAVFCLKQKTKNLN